MSEKSNTDFKRESIPLDFAKLASMIVKDLNSNSSSLFKKYTKENLTTFLKDPIKNSKNLQALSAYIYDSSTHYRRLINYYAKMATLDYYVEPFDLDLSKKVNVKTFKNAYQKASSYVELLNIKHEVGKALVTAWKIGTFYGYEVKTKDSYFIMELPYQYCQISGIYDGVMTFSFDVTYFDKYPEQLEFYPKEFGRLYKKFKNDGLKWKEIDPKNTVCIKIGEDSYTDLPPFIGVLADLFDIADYKELRKINEVLGTFRFIVEKIPIRENSEKNNDFSIDLGTVKMFHNKTASLLPDEIGIFSTPFDIDVVEFSKDKTNKDTVDEAEQSLYTASGTSQLLFNSVKSTQSGLAKSINVDESEIFLTLRQLERIISTKIKDEIKGSFKFRLKILNNTIFNKKENIEMYLKNAQFGLPVKTILCASLGLSPSATTSMAFLENEVLGLNDSFIPLSSSHTQTSKENNSDEDKNGRPNSSDEEISEKGTEQREREDNANREQ